MANPSGLSKRQGTVHDPRTSQKQGPNSKWSPRTQACTLPGRSPSIVSDDGPLGEVESLAL